MGPSKVGSRRGRAKKGDVRPRIDSWDGVYPSADGVLTLTTVRRWCLGLSEAVEGALESLREAPECKQEEPPLLSASSRGTGQPGGHGRVGRLPALGRSLPASKRKAQRALPPLLRSTSLIRHSRQNRRTFPRTAFPGTRPSSIGESPLFVYGPVL
jgi:hypothetical protein